MDPDQGGPKKYGSCGYGTATQQQTILDASQHPPKKWKLRDGIRSIVVVELRTVLKTRPHRLYLFGISFTFTLEVCELRLAEVEERCPHTGQMKGLASE
jgi:hypothetical protein